MLKPLWTDAWAAMRGDAWLALFTLFISTAPMVYADLYLDEMDGFRLAGLLSIVLIPFQIAIIARALARHGMNDGSGRPYFLRAFGQSLLSGLAILLGLLLLIVPGLILSLRWALAMPVLIAQDCGVADSLTRSWDMTRGKAMLVLGAYLPAIGLLVAGIVATVALPIDLPSVILGETLLSAVFIAAWYLQTSLYAVLAGADQNPA